MIGMCMHMLIRRQCNVNPTEWPRRQPSIAARRPSWRAEYERCPTSRRPLPRTKPPIKQAPMVDAAALKVEVVGALKVSLIGFGGPV